MVIGAERPWPRWSWGGLCPAPRAQTRLPILGGGLGSRKGWWTGVEGVTREAEGACWSRAFSLLVWHVYPLARPSTAPLCSLHPKSEPAGSQASPTVRPHFRELRWRPPASHDPKARRHLGSGTATGSERPPTQAGLPVRPAPPPRAPLPLCPLLAPTRNGRPDSSGPAAPPRPSPECPVGNPVPGVRPRWPGPFRAAASPDLSPLTHSWRLGLVLIPPPRAASPAGPIRADETDQKVQ